MSGCMRQAQAARTLRVAALLLHLVRRIPAEGLKLGGAGHAAVRLAKVAQPGAQRLECLLLRGVGRQLCVGRGEQARASGDAGLVEAC